MQKLSQGNEYTIVYTVYNEDGSIKDLSGTLQLKYQLAKRKTEVPFISYTLTDPELTITDPSNGKISIHLSSDELNLLNEGIHYHEIWQVNALGQPTTLMAEKIEIFAKLIKI